MLPTAARRTPLFALFALLIVIPAVTQGQIGSPLPNMKPVETSFFNNGKLQFNRVWGMKEGSALCSRTERVNVVTIRLCLAAVATDC